MNQTLCHRLLCVVFAALFSFGCEEYEYTIRIKPQGPHISRTLICSQNVPEEYLQSIARIYEQRIDKSTFTGQFEKYLPQDIGGYGIYHYINDPMGEVYAYIERFRGSDNPAEQLQNRFDLYDQVVCVILDWFEYELGDEPNFDSLQQFIDVEFRTDIKNLDIYTWLGKNPDDSEREEMDVRSLLYMIERDYMTLNDYFSIKEGDPNVILPLVKNHVARQLGYIETGQIDKKLDLLSGFDEVVDSLRQFISNSARCIQFIDEKKKEIIAQGESFIEPDFTSLESDTIIEILLEAYDIDLDLLFENLIDFAPYDSLTIKIECDQKPYFTNGQWQSDSAILRWSKKVRRDTHDDLPFLCYAYYAIPNNEYQMEHFGSTLFKDEMLMSYCIWRNGLDYAHRQEWDNFIAGVNPGDALSQMKVFRFSDDTKPGIDFKDVHEE